MRRIMIVGGLAALLLSPLRANAQAADPAYTISPTSGPKGTTITFTGTGCLGDGTPGNNTGGPAVYEGHDGLFAFEDNPDADNAGIQQNEHAFIDGEPDGTFTGQIDVPSGTTTVGQTYETALACNAGDGYARSDRSGDGRGPATPQADRRFTVTEATSTTTLSTTSTTSATAGIGPGTASPSTAEPGRSTTLTGSGFASNETLSILLFSNPVSLGTTMSDSSGSYSQSVVIPRGTPAGSHTIVVSGPGREGGSFKTEVAIEVRAPADTLALTGGGTAQRSGLFGAFLALLGLSLLWWRRAPADIDAWV